MRKPTLLDPGVVGRISRTRVAKPSRPGPTAPRVRPAPSPTPARPGGIRAEVEAEVRQIRERLTLVEAEFYAIGKQLLALDRPEVLAAFGVKTFDQFLDAHVMPAGSAHRYMTVAREYDAAQAAELGVTKAYHLVQYARLAATPFRASVLARRDVKIGLPKRPISTLTAVDVADAVRRLKMDQGKAAIPKPSTRERSAAKRLVAQFEDRFGLDATMRIDKKRGVLRLEVKLSELVE